MNALKLLLDWASSLFVALFILRFVLQAVRADFYNPISQAVVNITNPLVMPLRRVIPGWRGWDMASLVAAVLVQLAFIVIMHVLFASGGIDPLRLLIGGLLRIVNLVISLYTMMIFISVILSWIRPDPRNPVISLLWSVTEPVLRPIRKLIPPMGGLDLSAMVALLGLILLRVLINNDIAPLLFR